MKKIVILWVVAGLVTGYSMMGRTEEKPNPAARGRPVLSVITLPSSGGVKAEPPGDVPAARQAPGPKIKRSSAETFQRRAQRSMKLAASFQKQEKRLLAKKNPEAAAHFRKLAELEEAQAKEFEALAAVAQK